MMFPKLISLLTIVEILSLIGSSFSATLVNLKEKYQFQVYNHLRDKSVHRGVLLSLSADQKNEICQDAFSAQLYVSSEAELSGAGIRRLVRDDSTVTDEPKESQHDLIVAQLTFEKSTESTTDLTFRCVGHFTKRKKHKETSFYVSSAYQPKWLYSNFSFLINKAKEFDPLNYILLSPDFVEQAQLEKRFVDLLRTINALRKESSEYVAEIEKRDILLTLTRDQKQILCSSVISTPIYRKERLEFYAMWLLGTRGEFEIEEKFLSLRNPDPHAEPLSVRCILCKALENETDPDDKTTSLYLTSSFDDAYSIVVLKEDKNGLFVDKYFQNIPLFIAARENMNYQRLFLNYVD